MEANKEFKSLLKRWRKYSHILKAVEQDLDEFSCTINKIREDVKENKGMSKELADKADNLLKSVMNGLVEHHACEMVEFDMNW